MQFNSYSIIWIHLIAYCHNETLVLEPFRHVQSSGLNIYYICVWIWLWSVRQKREKWNGCWNAKDGGNDAKIESYTDSISSLHLTRLDSRTYTRGKCHIIFISNKHIHTDNRKTSLEYHYHYHYNFFHTRHPNAFYPSRGPFGCFFCGLFATARTQTHSHQPHHWEYS